MSEETESEPQPSLRVEDLRLTDILQTLSDPNRLLVVQRLADGEWHSFGIEAWGGLHKSTVTHHLRSLRDSGLVEYRMVGRNKELRLRQDAVESRFPGLLAGVISEQAVSDLQGRV